MKIKKSKEKKSCRGQKQYTKQDVLDASFEQVLWFTDKVGLGVDFILEERKTKHWLIYLIKDVELVGTEVDNKEAILVEGAEFERIVKNWSERQWLAGRRKKRITLKQIREADLKKFGYVLGNVLKIKGIGYTDQLWEVVREDGGIPEFCFFKFGNGSRMQGVVVPYSFSSITHITPFGESSAMDGDEENDSANAEF